MGMNFYTACHKCRVKIFHFRSRENETLQPFYREHWRCIKENPANVETLSDYGQEQPWMQEEAEGGYPDCNVKP